MDKISYILHKGELPASCLEDRFIGRDTSLSLTSDSGASSLHGSYKSERNQLFYHWGTVRLCW